MEVDSRYMARALELARLGRGLTHPNPMVGAVIVADGRIIGEGYHHRYGGPHAEVCAVSSVTDRPLLSRSTIYVTLEPCSHYGKTPPCAKLLIDCRIPRVVVGCTDPNERVAGRGIAMLREAGAEVVTGVLESECQALNRPFITAHTKGRPYVMLKWAQSADGFMAADGKPVTFSTPLSAVAVHQLRADFDAIAVGSGTVSADNPRLDTRLYAGRSPRAAVIDRRGTSPAGASVYQRPDTILITTVRRDDIPAHVTQLTCTPEAGPEEVLRLLSDSGVQSLMVEGGAELLTSFMASGLWDDARIEIAPVSLGARGSAPIALPRGTVSTCKIGRNTIINVKNG